MKDDHGGQNQHEQQQTGPDTEQTEKHDDVTRRSWERIDLRARAFTMRLRAIKTPRKTSGSIRMSTFSIIAL
jgi:hypothetical protein